MIYLLAFLMGTIAGLRAMTAPAAVSWGAYFGFLGLTGTWLAFLGSIWTVLILTALAIAELITDQLPSTPKRTVPMQFATRVITGAFAGAAIGAGFGQWPGALAAGAIGAVAGTFGGAAFRSAMAKAFRRDAPAAFIEDAIAVVGAWLIINALTVFAVS
ncbi:hypothetical protein REJC140_00736 [Pseudorhizobium endolithicum]|uniref:DUF4126 domain-containing protein n=1 Tax=Pseudorhizobium endolithicum TaxID=1191678 RepID=A0ABN7JRL1_9HYPH|nr:DUF4126 family protein [Pseudorhizobium endolithicum]CAD6406821.1 hypothetical protein REQ54_00193 [Rhizobium sp. Q54]CAD7039306.1 hypothetical protein REJC140_00736 [Pseudorhizobium endolithicum]